MWKIRGEGDSVGAKVTVIARGVPPGLGEPVFDRLDADIAHAMMGINAVKAVEIGAGVASAAQRGSEHRDELTPTGFLSNNAGGMLGGISSGQDIVVHVTLKPTSSIQVPGRTIDVAGNPVEVVTTGRHDPCVGLRATPICEAMLAIVLMDHYLRHRGQNADVRSSTRRSSPAKVVSHGRAGKEGLSGRRARRHRPRGRHHDPRAPGARFPGVASCCRSPATARWARRVEFRGRHIPVIDVATFDFKRAQIGLFSAGGEVSREYAPKAAAAGCIVIDNTSEFRYQDDIPLVVPEVNAHAIVEYKKRGIIANPNCSTIQMVVALKPIHDAVGIARINVATYQSVSGAGKEAVDELAAQTTSAHERRGAGQAQGHRQADRLQLRAADRQVHGQRLHQGRDEDGVGDPEDPR